MFRLRTRSRLQSIHHITNTGRPHPHARPLSSQVRGVATGARRIFDPKAILPHQYGQVRICSNTVRDAQQSNLSAEMADVHRQQIGRMINAVYKDIQSPHTGYEQIWGGTIPMFDVWKRGVQPFEELREMTANMPDTPTSCLVRSNALNAMSNQPADVVDAFIRLAVESGLNVFTNFCAHNDPRNHAPVAEAVLKYGGHYQAAISWAVDAEDPTIYNVQWAVDLCRELVAMGAHSLYIKDPSGVLTPEMAGALASEIKSAFPELPLVFHTHYQTGFAYMTYLEAVKNGANGIECSVGFPDGAGQPYSMTMLRALQDFGFDTGLGPSSRDAMHAIADECKKLRNLYPQAMVVRTPDVRVEETGIAGGQRSILDKELQDCGQPHLIPAVDKEVQRVRAQGGKVCQVTPVADSYAREAMRRLRGGSSTSSFTPGYASILTGESGLVKHPVEPLLQERALFDRATAKLQQLADEQKISSQTIAQMKQHNVIQTMVEQMRVLSIPIVSKARLSEVEARIRQLNTINSKPQLRDSLNRRILSAGATDSVKNTPIRSIDDRIRILKRERDQLKQILTQKAPVDQQTYEALTLGRAADSVYDMLLSAPESSVLRKLVSSKDLSLPCYRQLIAAAGVYTAPPILLLPPAMESAKEWVKQLDQQHLLGLTDDDRTWEESAVIQSSYAKSAIPGLVTDFLCNYKENPSFWKPTYTVTNGAADKPKAPDSSSSFLKRGVHCRVESLVGSDLLSFIRNTHQQRLTQMERLDRMKKDPALAARFPSRTITRIQERVTQLQQQQHQQTTQAEQLLERAITSNPGQFVTVYPSMTNPNPQQDVTSEIQMAKQLLTQLIQA